MKVRVTSVRRGYSGCNIFIDYEIVDDNGNLLEKASSCFSEERWSDKACEDSLRGALERAASSDPQIIEAIRSNWLGKEITQSRHDLAV